MFNGKSLPGAILVTILAVSCLQMQVAIFANQDTSENPPIFTDGNSTTRSVEENTAAGTDIGAPIGATDADGDVLIYDICGSYDHTSFSIDTTSGQLRTKAALDFETKSSYKLIVFVVDSTGRVSYADEIDVTINVIDVDETPTNDVNKKSIHNALITNVNGKIRQQRQKIYPPVENSDETSPEVTRPPPLVKTSPVPKGRILQQCPVGWVRSDGFAGSTRRALLYEVKLDMNIHNRVSIYKPTSVAIYVHPDEGLETLDGWELHVAVPNNQHREYPLTAENSVVVASKMEGVAGGFAVIENPEATPFPMTGMGFTGALTPSFDYRLYDDTGKRVDYGIACYKRSNIFQVLKAMEAPSVLRKVDLETLDWDASYLRSEWTVPVPVNVPGAPSLQRVNLVGKWGDLKKQ